MNKQTALRILAGVYLLPMLLTGFSLSVPPADFPLFVFMLAIAAFGLCLTSPESPKWRVAWTVALVIALLGGAFELLAGKRLAQQRLKNGSSLVSTNR